MSYFQDTHNDIFLQINKHLQNCYIFFSIISSMFFIGQEKVHSCNATHNSYGCYFISTKMFLNFGISNI